MVLSSRGSHGYRPKIFLKFVLSRIQLPPSCCYFASLIQSSFVFWRNVVDSSFACINNSFQRITFCIRTLANLFQAFRNNNFRVYWQGAYFSFIQVVHSIRSKTTSIGLNYHKKLVSFLLNAVILLCCFWFSNKIPPGFLIKKVNTNPCRPFQFQNQFN